PGKKSELWTSNIDGTNKQKITSSNNLATGFWSPDGSQISFYDIMGKGIKTYIVNPDERNLHPLEKLPGTFGTLIWSADGKSFFGSGYSVQNPIPAVWRTNPDGTNVEKIADSFVAMDASHDGKFLLGELRFGNESGIYSVSIAEKKRTLLIPNVDTFIIRIA